MRGAVCRSPARTPGTKTFPRAGLTRFLKKHKDKICIRSSQTIAKKRPQPSQHFTESLTHYRQEWAFDADRCGERRGKEAGCMHGTRSASQAVRCKRVILPSATGMTSRSQCRRSKSGEIYRQLVMGSVMHNENARGLLLAAAHEAEQLSFNERNYRRRISRHWN